MMFKISLSRHFIIDIKATGLLWLGSEGRGVLGTGMLVDVFQRVGTDDALVFSCIAGFIC